MVLCRSRMPATTCCRAALAACILLLAACGTSPPKSPSSSSSPISGKYYKDDGPGDTPANIDSIPDATPRLEPLHRFANRPYTVLGQDFVPATSLRPYK